MGQAAQEAAGSDEPERVYIITGHYDSRVTDVNNFTDDAPGADDDGTGTVNSIEVLRVLVESGWKPATPVEFHWYSAEEGGLLGSQAIFQSYEKAGRDVKAMLQQDMTGYVQKTLDAGEPYATAYSLTLYAGNDYLSAFAAGIDYIGKSRKEFSTCLFIFYLQ